MTNQLVIPFRGLDANASPASAAQCYIYRSGTTTAEVVTDASGTALGSVVSADVNGAWPQMFYAGAYQLKAVLKDADGVTLPGGTIDPVALVSSTATAGDVVFTASDDVPETDVQAAIDYLGVRVSKTITAGTGISVTNGDAVAGNPTIAVATGPLSQLAGMSLVQGDVLYRDGTGLTRLAIGTALQHLRVNAGATAPEWATPQLTMQTSQATTSGTTVDFTSIPSWVRRITVIFAGVSLNNSDTIFVQIGTSSGVVSSGYASSSATIDGSTTAGVNTTSAFIVFCGSSSDSLNGHMVLTRLASASNEWIASHSVSRGSQIATGGGRLALSAALDRVRLTSSATGTFDAGSVNLILE